MNSQLILSFCMLFILSCSSPKQFIKLTSDNGKTRVVHPNFTSSYTLGVDSQRVDSAQFLSLGETWKIIAANPEDQSIEFVSAVKGNRKMVLRKDQIRYLKVHVTNSEKVMDQTVSIAVFTGFVVGSLGIFFGSIALPIPSTSWKEDADLILRGAGILGITFLVSYLIDDNNQYKVTEIH